MIAYLSSLWTNDGYYTMAYKIFRTSDDIEKVNAQAEFYELTAYQI